MTNTLTKKNGSQQVQQPAPTARRVVYTPRVDILELPEKLVLTLDMPGVRPEDVEINFERGELTVAGKRQPVEHKGLGIAQAFMRRSGPPALADPCLRRVLLDDAHQRFADLRKDVNVLMAVEIIRRAAERAVEAIELPADFIFERHGL